jgi:hypothetical protein
MESPVMRRLRLQLEATASQRKLQAERQQKQESARRERLKKLWKGFSAGDTVIFTPDITAEEYSVTLTDDNGEAIRLDGRIEEIQGDKALVRIMKIYGQLLSGKPMAGILRLVRRNQIERVYDGEPSYWGGASSLVEIQRQRDGGSRLHPASEIVQFWEPSEPDIEN